MTDAATGVYPRRRPSPYPRTRVDGPTLHVVPTVTQGDPETCNAESAGALTEPKIKANATDTLKSAITAGSSRVGVWVAASRAYWTPPQVFTDRPASLADLAEYARTAPWTTQDAGIVRAGGVWYYRLVAYPYTVVSRYREWFAQRPLRLVALAGSVKLAAATDPGVWVVNHVVYPVFTAAGRVLL